MPASALAPHQLRLTIDPATLGFASTAELQDLPLPWIGQERAQAAAQFGLGLHQPDYHLFVLGEVGSGRASLLRQAMQTAAAERAVPPPTSRPRRSASRKPGRRKKAKPLPCSTRLPRRASSA